MKPNPSTQSLLAPLILTLLSPALLAAEGAAPVEFLPGRAVIHEGTGKVMQKSGDDVLADVDLDLRAVTVVREGPNERTLRLLVGRTFRSAKAEGDGEEDGEQLSGGVVRHALVEKKTGRVVSLPLPQELDFPDRDARIYFPFDVVPPFEVPAAGKGLDATQEVLVIGQIPARGTFKVTHESSDGRHVIRRLLEEGSAPRLEFNGAPARLSAWREEYVYSDDRRVLERATRTSTMVVGVGEDSLEVTVSSDVAARKVATKDDSAALFAAVEALESIEAAMRARKPGGEIAPAVAKLESDVKGASHDALGRLASTHLAAYRETFETSDEGKLLRDLVGSPPPDFTLEDLEGKKRNFRDLIRGKVAYLTFWGVG